MSSVLNFNIKINSFTSGFPFVIVRAVAISSLEVANVFKLSATGKK
jgi:hypothetical protein